MSAWRPGEAGRVGISEARRALNMATSERELQRTIADLADLGRWRWFHDADARLNRAGLPDIIAVRAPRLVFMELKREEGRLRPEQEEWLAELGRCTSVEAFLWRPDQFDEAREVLR